MSVIGETLVRVKALVDANQVKRDVRTGVTAGTQAGLRGALSRSSVSPLLKGAGIATVATLVGQQVASEINKSINEATRAQKVQDVLRNSLAATGQEWSKYAGFIEQAVEEQSKLSAFEDEDLFEQLSILQRRTGDVSKSLRLLALSEDIARGSGRELGTVVSAVGRASDNQTAALTRLGIQVRKGETGVQALTEAQRKYAGAAQAFGDSSSGAFQKLSNSANNLREELGGPLAAAFGRLAADGSAGLDTLNAAISETKSLVDRTGTGGFLKSVASHAVATAVPALSLLEILRRIRHEAETPISPPTEGLLSASRVEDIRGGERAATPTGPATLGRRTQLELQLRVAERRGDLQDQLRIARELADIARKRVDIVKTAGPLLAQRKEEEQDALDRIARIQQEIDQNAADAAAARAAAAKQAADEARRRAEEAKRAREEAERAAAEALRQDLADTESGLRNNLLRAQLTTKKLADDRKALQALIRFYREQTKNTKLEKSERLSFEASLLQTRADLQNLNQRANQGTAGATVGDFFGAAIANFKAFGSNVAGRGGVLSSQDERAAFAFEALKRINGGAGLDTLAGMGTGVGARAGVGLGDVVQEQRRASNAQLAETRITNNLLRRIVGEGANVGVGRTKPKVSEWSMAAAAAEGLWITGA